MHTVKLMIQYHSDAKGDVQGVMFMGDTEPLEGVGRFAMTARQWEGFKQAISLGSTSNYCRMLEPVDLINRPLDGLFAEAKKQ